MIYTERNGERTRPTVVGRYIYMNEADLGAPIPLWVIDVSGVLAVKHPVTGVTMLLELLAPGRWWGPFETENEGAP